MTNTLPRDDQGFITTSAEFGEHVIVEITYNTHADGAEVLEGDETPRTLHGPFADYDEAEDWMNAYPDGDTNIVDMTTITLNAVRPKE